MFLAPIVSAPRYVLAWPRTMIQAWRRGRRASWLLAEPLEDMLALPLDEVRRRLGIQPLAEAHPQGLLVGDLWEGDLRVVPTRLGRERGDQPVQRGAQVV